MELFDVRSPDFSVGSNGAERAAFRQSCGTGEAAGAGVRVGLTERRCIVHVFMYNLFSEDLYPATSVHVDQFQKQMDFCAGRLLLFCCLTDGSKHDH